MIQISYNIIMFDPSIYQLHVFSLLPSLTPNNNPTDTPSNLTEEQVLDDVTALDREWYKEVNRRDGLDIEGKKEELRKQLHENDGVIVLVQDRSSERMVAYAVMTRDTTASEPREHINETFILSGHRGRHISTAIFERELEIAQALGAREITTTPNRHSLGIIRHRGYVPAGETLYVYRIPNQSKGIPSPGNTEPGRKK